MTPLPARTDAVKPAIALSVVIPAFNEAQRLTRTLAATTEYLSRTQSAGAWEIIIVDDGSRDDTVRVARDWAAAQGEAATACVRVLRYEANRGKGYAVRYGIMEAVGEFILFMDADLATPIEELSKLQVALTEGKASVAIGSRPLQASELLVRQPLYRELLGRVFNHVVQAAATPGIRDTQCGFKLWTRNAARSVFSRCILDGFSFDVEALFLARKLGYAIAEVPVRWAHQEGAAAFATKGAYLRHGLRMVADLIRIRWAHRALSFSSSDHAVAPVSAFPRHPA